MDPKELKVDVIHPSLTQPVLWAGVERRVIGAEFLIAVLLITWKGMTLPALLLVVCLVLPIHLVARRVARADPCMFDLFLRSLAWRRFYPPHAHVHAATPAVKPSIPGAK